MPTIADCIDVAAELAEDRSAMVAPVDAREHRAGDDATLVLRQVFVREAPGALDVDDADVASPAAGLRPRPARIDAARRCVQVDLPGAQIGRGRWGLLRRRRHVVDARQFDTRLDERRFDELVPRELGLQLGHATLGDLHLVEDGKILHRRLRRHAVRRLPRHDPLLGRSEDGLHRRAVTREHLRDVGHFLACGRHEPSGRGPECGLRTHDDDKLRVRCDAWRRPPSFVSRFCECAFVPCLISLRQNAPPDERRSHGSSFPGPFNQP
jgi:hypothetical protein